MSSFECASIEREEHVNAQVKPPESEAPIMAEEYVADTKRNPLTASQSSDQSPRR